MSHVLIEPPSAHRWAARLPRLPFSFSIQGVIAVVLLTVVVLGALFAPLLSAYDPNHQELAARLTAPDWNWFSSNDHPLGTDSLGRDLWTRVLYGGRVSASIAIAAVILGTAIGASVGLVAGYARGITDRLLMRFTDMQLALPPVVLGLAVVAVRGADLPSLIVLMALGVWPPIARVFRAEVLSLRTREYVEASRVIGGSGYYTLTRHVLFNAAGPGIVIATNELGRAVLFAASLSFLGLGIQPPTADWGAMLSEGRSYLASAWWICLFPGIALVVLVTGVNLAGDWLRDRLDPQVNHS
jgi:peptide/nickel transport system permease protein